MPDVHWGYGFPIGGVAATDVEDGGVVSPCGVVSPGGVGFDISCGVRLLAADVGCDDLAAALPAVMDHLDTAIPRGPGPGGIWQLKGPAELSRILTDGSRHAVERGQGEERDLLRCEDGGAVGDARVDQVGELARRRGFAQVGSLGSGNHFLEVQHVAAVYDPAVAQAFGLRLGQVRVMIHSGSRGLGHQVCSDHVRIIAAAMHRHGITVPDRQLACAPVTSPEGVRLDLVYDVSHNLAKLEQHVVAGRPRKLCVHRKGATLALPPGHLDLPEDLRAVGQLVLLPCTMGTASYVLTGVQTNAAFCSTCHGAGRVMSRHAAVRMVNGRQLMSRLEDHGILVRPRSWQGLAEETPPRRTRTSGP
jgi:tRNA-splicing ligase RtcB